MMMPSSFPPPPKINALFMESVGFIVKTINLGIKLLKLPILSHPLPTRVMCPMEFKKVILRATIKCIKRWEFWRNSEERVFRRLPVVGLRGVGAGADSSPAKNRGRRLSIAPPRSSVVALRTTNQSNHSNQRPPFYRKWHFNCRISKGMEIKVSHEGGMLA